MRNGSPPPSYYDPPNPRHSNGSIIPLECSCEDCHRWHKIEDVVRDHATYSPGDYLCCVEEVENENDN